MTKTGREEEKQKREEAKNWTAESQGKYIYRIRDPLGQENNKTEQQRERKGGRQGRGKGGRDVKDNGKNVHSVNKLNCFYTNADQLKNKFAEFETRISEQPPEIIGITEVRPKHSRFKQQPSEFNLDHIAEYDVGCLFAKNIDTKCGRGLILYTRRHLDAKEITLKTEYEENIMVEIKINKKDRLLIGLIYRSPSDRSPTSHNNQKLLQLLTEANKMGHSVYGRFQLTRYRLDNMEQ